ncbi:hypothetical protein [Streptomyces sudanensis]|uniref:hypothetical protein n=1 Tax=Streptomyces sudanensis TaxID=436397 RepID=UPI0020CE880A|nr:hypothetical protein [Streptomyces sudanensis]MCP9957519.1 hypothetical protein [Streptomyces sudanensis]MCQ0001936.1 hypothetical protein [Streptomyces sudanensis]
MASVVLIALLSGCGNDGGRSGAMEPPQQTDNASSGPAEQNKSTDGAADPSVPDTSKTLATLDGGDGFQFVVHSAVRDPGGFLTVSATLKNTSSQTLLTKSQWSGNEVNVKRTGLSFAGITLVDKSEKKRYYVLRDTEGYPLTTTGVTSLEAGKSVAVFAQFPAPPTNVGHLDIQVPLMPPATIEIS